MTMSVEVREVFDNLTKVIASCAKKVPFSIDLSVSTLKKTVNLLKETHGSLLFKPRIKVLLVLKRGVIELLSYANQVGVSGKQLARLNRYSLAVDCQISIKAYEAKLALLSRDLKKLHSSRKKTTDINEYLIDVENRLDDIEVNLESDLTDENMLSEINGIDNISLKKLKDEKKLKNLQAEVIQLKERATLLHYEKQSRELENQASITDEKEFLSQIKSLTKNGFCEFIPKVSSEKMLAKIYIENSERRRDLISSLSSKNKQKRVLSQAMTKMSQELKHADEMLQGKNELELSLVVARLSDFFGYLRGHISHRNLIDKTTFKRTSKQFDNLLKEIAIQKQ